MWLFTQASFVLCFYLSRNNWASPLIWPTVGGPGAPPRIAHLIGPSKGKFNRTFVNGLHISQFISKYSFSFYTVRLTSSLFLVNYVDFWLIINRLAWVAAPSPYSFTLVSALLALLPISVFFAFLPFSVLSALHI